MKRFLLSYILLSFLALGVSSGVFASDALAAGHGKESESKKEDDNISGGRFAGDPIYVRIAPMVLPIINDDGVEQLVSLIITIHVKDLAAADALHKNMPRAMDSLLRQLYGGLDEGSLRKGRLVNIPKIKSKAVFAIGEVIGKENVRDVLVEGISQRML